MEVIYQNIFYLTLLVSNYYIIASKELTLQKRAQICRYLIFSYKIQISALCMIQSLALPKSKDS